MQQRAALWIRGMFWTSPTLGVEAISELVPIHLYLRKLYRRFLLWQSFFPPNHIINSILSSSRSQEQNCHNTSIDYLTTKQRLHLKFLFINVGDKCNEFFPSFFFFNEEFKLGNWLVDLFPDHFSFYPYSSNVKKHIKNLDKITLRASFDPTSTIVVSNTSIKNHVATLIFHIYFFNKPIVKTIHRTINVTITEAKLFAIWYSIN